MATQDPKQDPQQLIAIVGMAGRFPQAPDVQSLWDLMVNRGDAIAPIPKERWDTSEQLDPEKRVQSVGGFLSKVDEFDPMFFGISPREAEDIDPQHRLMLEASFTAIEDAGQPMEQLREARVGVYVGASWHDYEILRKERAAATTQHTAVGNALDMIAARVSYFYKFKGPSLTVETGCSSSLVALHLACQALREGDIEAAVVGGVNLILAPDVSIGLTHFGGLSPDGRCKAFAASANGFVRGEGVVALYVKTLASALRDGDRIHGVIVRTEVNNDGGGDSLVTPFSRGQEDLLRRAYEAAAVPLDQLAYVEAHGTGTSRGDPIETGAIGRVLGQARDPSAGPLAVGSVKTNIGHLEACAGLAGLIKVVLSLKHGVVPPTLHADTLNPNIPFDELNLQVVREPLALPAEGDVYMGVNSFGWGGTNAHAVLRNAPRVVAEVAASSGAPVLVPLSAHNEEALVTRAKELAAHITDDADVAALAGTLGRRKSQHVQRAAFVAASGAELKAQLERFAAGPQACEDAVAQGRARSRGRVAFVFPGQGSQWAIMGKELFVTSARFAEVIRRCAEALRPFVSWDLVEFVSGAAGDSWLAGIDTLQPTLWGMSVALAELWREAGVEPDVVVGHSMGEVAAATVAGILSYEDAARIIARRSAIAQSKAGKGQMLAVDLSIEGARAALAGFEDRVSLAVNNGPSSCVLSGDTDAVGMLKELLEADGTFCRLVRVDFASHSHQMDEFKEELFNSLAGVRPRDGGTALLSTVLVRELSGAEMDAAYWVKNLREPVLFADAMSKAFDAGVTHVIEVSPHPILTPAIEQLAALRSDVPSVLATLRRDFGSLRDMGRAFALAYVAGLAPFAALPLVDLALPAYPFQRKSYWPSAQKRRSAKSGFELTLAPSAIEQDAWEASLELGRQENPWLNDHKVHEAVVLPGVAMLALAASAARARTGVTPRVLSNVRFRAHLTLGDEPAHVRVLWRDDVSEGGSVSLYSLPAGATRWTEHASGRFERAKQPPEVSLFPARMCDGTPLDGADFYQGCAARGLNYGPAFQGVQRIYVEGDRALGEVKLSDACAASLRAHGLHPALWDGALQVSLALCAGGHTVVPTGVARVVWLDAMETPVRALWVHALRNAADRFDLVLYGEQRQPLMLLEGLTLETLASSEAPAEDERVHRLAFVEAARGAARPAHGPFVICGADEDGAQALAQDLITQGRSTFRAHYEVSSEDPQPAAWFGRALTDTLRTAGDAATVVFAAPRAQDGAAQRRGLSALTALVRACGTLATPPRLFVVSANAQRVRAEDVPAADTGVYWGFTRVLRREHPELSPVVVDIDPFDPSWPAACAAELCATDDDDQVVLRGERRFVGRLVRGTGTQEQERETRVWTGPVQPFRLVSRKAGTFDALEYRPLERDAPAAHEVEIEVSAAALNFIDVMKAMGTYPGVDGRAAQLGGECAGRVVRVGASVSALRPGDRVVACQFGAFASHLTLRADHVQRVPKGLSDEQAAALPLVMLTAWYGLNDLARLRPGESVLIHSATGGLGLAALQVAKLLGARVLATAGSAEKRSWLRAQGVEHVFDSRDSAWADGVLAATCDKGVDVVLNSLTGAAIQLGLDVLAEDGRFIEVGKKDIYGGRNLRLDAFKKGISLAAVDLAGLMERRPERFAELFEALWSRVARGELAALPTLPYAFADAAEALREMSRGNHVGKFVLRAPESVRSAVPEPMPRGQFRAHGTYVISGGLGALALSLAKFMVERGARSLLLLGRSEPSAQAKQSIAELAAVGAKIETRAVDVADPQALGACLQEARGQLPLRGVIHAAGLLQDAIIANLTADQLTRVLAPKVEGARNLDALTREDPLDLFVMFSSAASLIGNAGQAAYAAGNAFMDSLAEARLAQGLPALSVQWGPFAEIGLAAQDAARGARLEERGMGSFSAEEAWQALARLLGGELPVVGYVPLALRQWFDAYPDTAALKSWQTLRAAAQSGASKQLGGEFMLQLRGSEEAARRELAESKVRELAGRVLRIDPSAIERDMPFKALGLDSLMGLELRNRLEAVFGLKLSPTLLWTYGNSRDLAGVLCERVTASAAA
jgi:phthiocerol/phenolphthiocerol synthesis type-I polyketide synthase C